MSNFPRITIRKFVSLPVQGEPIEVTIDIEFDYGKHEASREALEMAYKSALGDLDAITDRQPNG